MFINRFTSADSRGIENFGSFGAKIKLVFRDADNLQIVFLSLDPDGVLGSHKATTDQLLIVVQGNGYVSGDSALEFVPVESGCAVFWRKGEMHETRAGENGLTAVVIEGDKLNLKEVHKILT